jgi:phosphoglycolate phosphatase
LTTAPDRTAVRLFALDLDGTLIDSRGDLATATNDFLVERGALPLPEDAVGRMVGEGARVLVSRASAAAGLPPPDDAAMARFLALYDTHLLDSTRPYEGIPDLLASFRARAHVAVLTNKPLAASRRVLEALGLATFVEDCLGGDGPHARKPSPEGLRQLMTAFGADPASTWLVGDSAIDLQTARNGGVRFALAAYGFGCTDDLPSKTAPGDVVARSAAELMTIVRT